MLKSLLLMLLVTIPVVGYTDEKSSDATENNKTEEQEADKNKNNRAESPDTFDPTEKVSDDVSVAFPVDI